MKNAVLTTLVAASLVFFAREFYRGTPHPRIVSTVCGLAPGSFGYTVPWAFTGGYPVYSASQGTVDTFIMRRGDNIHFETLNKANDLAGVKRRELWDCRSDEVAK